MPTPGLVHDPLQPLVLGDNTSGLYCTQTYDSGAKRWTLHVIDGAKISTMTLDADGGLLINGITLGNLPSIAAAVAAATAAASNAAASAVAAQNFATNAQEFAADANISAASAETSDTNAQASATAADASALLSSQYANAPTTVSLPGGGVSSKVSADRAASYAVSTRDLPLLTAVSGDKTYLAAWLYARQPFTGAGLQTVTVPANIFQSPDPKTAFGLLQNRSATGSIKVIGSSAVTNLQPATIKAQIGYRYRSPGTSAWPATVFIDIPCPAITNGAIYLNLAVGYRSVGSSPVFTVTADKGLTPAGIQLLPSPPPYANDSVPAVYKIPLVAKPAQTVRVTFALGNLGYWLDCHAWVIEGGGPTPAVYPAIAVANGARNVSVTTPLLSAQTLILGSAQQRGPIGTCVFSSFAGLAGQGGGDTQGLPDTTVLDTSANQNFASARGNALVGAAAATATVQANFTNASARPAVNLITIPAVVVPGAGGVTMHYENGVDTCVQAYGEIELTFDPDGNNVYVKMSQ